MLKRAAGIAAPSKAPGQLYSLLARAILASGMPCCDTERFVAAGVLWAEFPASVKKAPPEWRPFEPNQNSRLMDLLESFLHLRCHIFRQRRIVQFLGHFFPVVQHPVKKID